MAQDTPRALYVALLAATLLLVGIAASARAQTSVRVLPYTPYTPTFQSLAPDGSTLIVYGSGVSVLPDPARAPGVVASTNQAEVCGRNSAGMTYSQAHRQTSAEMKTEVRKRDGQARCGEIDHRLPLALGGADDTRNLWCQPGPPEPWSFKKKDALEVYVWDAVCHKHSMTLEDGQAIFLAPDWRRGFCQYIGGPPCEP